MKISKPSSNKQDSRKNNMLILSISKLDEDESSEISVFQLDKMDKVSIYFYFKSSNKNILKFFISNTPQFIVILKL